MGIAAVLDLLAGTTGNRPTADRQRSLARWAGQAGRRARGIVDDRW